MRQKKIYTAEKGVLLDGNFLTHAAHCKDCQRFEEAKPASIALMCLEGSVLWKRENAVHVERATQERGPNFASKADVKRAMRYK